MDKVPRFETSRLRLRAIFPADAKDIFEIYSDPQIAKFYDFPPFEKLAQASDLISRITSWFQNDIAIRWAIVEKQSGKVVGTCCFDSFQPAYESCNLGYNLNRSFWNQGFVTEAVREIIQFAFENGIHNPVYRIGAMTLPENRASEKVLTKLGFQQEGRMRSYGYWDGQRRDMNLFSLLKPDWTLN
ncbi:MAG: GNAT family protein [Planctomycetota bacterium]